MAKEDHCPKCGIELPFNAPEGLCPQCLMKAGMAEDSDVVASGPSALEGPGTKIDRYELLDQIGEGGMGLVYLAEQKEPVKRKVALKIVKLGMDTKQVVARFEAERQTLAVLEHPNIAHVFDAGTTEAGRPYFVMEYVEGKSVTKYCDEQKLSVEERLGLFQQVCEGVHHAHQKGIIHRDIKPSNILVTVREQRAVPKIIDFGIAKAITQPLSGKTAYTQQGQLLGTPEYMSPEQAEMAYQDVDTRSDIYSLGVLLYELLAGVPPFDAKRLREGGIDHIQQVICEEEPRTPSARLTSLGDTAKAVAESRRTQIITLTRRLHRELEWIPMKAMRKDRTRRYRSASELADDIQNYLTGTPLIAGPESSVYRARKFVRKHAGSVAMVALVAVAIVLGLVASIFMGCRAEQARKQEAAARKQVEQTLARAEKAERIAQEQRKLAEERAEAYRRAVYGNTLALAKEAIDDASFSRAQTLLKSCEPDLRGWEWEHLNHRSPDPCIKTHFVHWGDVYSLAVSPDGKRLASAGGEGRICITDTASGNVVMTLSVHSRPYIVVYSPDGTRIATGSQDGALRIWDAATGARLRTLYAHVGGFRSLAFSPDSTRIVSGNRDTMKVWDVNSGTELLTVQGNKDSAFSARITFNPDGKLIVSGCNDKTIRAWDAVTGAEMWTLTGHDSYVGCVSYSPDGSRLVSGDGVGIIKVWDAVTGAEIRTLTGHTSWMHEVVFSPDGKRIASGSCDRTVKIWDVASGDELKTLRGHDRQVTAVVFHPDGERVFSTTYLRGVVKEWDLGIDRNVLKFHGARGDTDQIAFSPNGKCIAGSVGSFQRKRITLWDADSGAEIMTLGGRWEPLAFSPDGKSICVGSQPGGVKLWESVEPAGGYGPRQTANSARDLVDELYEEHNRYDNVISRLEEDSTINDSVRKTALQLANNRLGREASKLSYSQSWRVVSSPNSTETEYRKVLETQEKAISSQPDNVYSIRLAIAQYRLGAYEEALTTLTRAKKIRDNAGFEFDDLIIEGFRAMALQQLGREAQVHAIIRQVRRGSRDSRWTKTRRYYQLQLVIEAETFFAGPDSTLVSIWELIGDDEFDKAADLVEEVRLSKNAERIRRMEDSGAAELLSILYDERGLYRWKNGGESSALIADHEKAARIDPNNSEALTELGRIYVNWPDPDIRDAKKAVEAATRVCELTDWKDHETINILAAVCSEAGDLEDAIKWQKTAMEHLPGDCPAAFKANYQAQLDLYESGKSYHKGTQWSFSDGELVSHWAFDEVQVGEVFDSTGKGYRGRLVGDADIVSDPERGHVLKLGRKGDYVDCGWHPGFNITGAMTIAVWTKVPGPISAPEEIITTNGTRLLLRNWGSPGEQNVLASQFECTSSALYKGGGTLMTTFSPESQWHLIVVCYEGEEFTTYIDSELTSSAHWTANREHFCGNIQMDTGPLTIGPRYTRQPMENPRGWKDMFIDDVRIYSYALSPDEVKMLYEGKEPPYKKGL